MIDDSVYRLEDAWPAEQRGPWGSKGGPGGGVLGFWQYLFLRNVVYFFVFPLYLDLSAGNGFEDAPPAYYYSTPCSLQDSSIGSEDASFLIRFLEL